MNITFHAVGSFATVAVLSLEPSENRRSVSALKKYVIGFVSGVLIHGILDLLPHNYPLPSKLDVMFALILLLAILFASQKQNLILIVICFIGAIFPDVIDLSPGIINKRLGFQISLLPFKIFPWHWKEFSGSVYDGSRNFESIVYHGLFLLICFSLIYVYRKRFLNL